MTRANPSYTLEMHFEVTDDSIPSDWIWQRFSDDEYYASPPELNAPGFFEDFFDHKEEAIRQFEFYLRRVRSEERRSREPVLTPNPDKSP